MTNPMLEMQTAISEDDLIKELGSSDQWTSPRDTQDFPVLARTPDGKVFRVVNVEWQFGKQRTILLLGREEDA